MPRLRLPLPESTGSDRDELLCTHGFVDRAYSVFFLRTTVSFDFSYCTCYCNNTMTGCASIPPLVFGYLEVESRGCAAWLREVDEGTSPWAPEAPCTSASIDAAASLHCNHALPTAAASRGPGWRSGGPRADGGADLRAIRSELETPVPHRDLLPPRACERSFDSQPVSAGDIQQGACQSLAFVRHGAAYVGTSLAFNDLANACRIV